MHRYPHEIYLAVDFEAACLTPIRWWAVGLILFDCESGEILEAHEIYVERRRSDFEQRVWDFFQTNKPAYEYLLARSVGHTQKASEGRLTTIVDTILKRYPLCRVISDHPAFDVALLDSIMLDHNHMITSCRTIPARDKSEIKSIYVKPLCVSTLKLFAPQNMTLPLPLRRLSAALHIYRTAHLHTPLYDCSCIIQDFLCLTSFRRNKKRCNRSVSNSRLPYKPSQKQLQ